jgi:hypothetical protein
VQLRDAYEEFRSRGAAIVAIGMGTPIEAAAFKREQNLPFHLLVDRARQSYRAAGMRVAPWSKVAGPAVWARGLKAIRGRGLRSARQDPRQLGGVIVVGRGGQVLYEHRSKTSADNPPLTELLGAVDDHS